MRSAEAVTPSTADTIPRQTELSRHPLDPHKPKFSSILPAFARPYPAFEGWFTRIWDPEANFTVAVIMATNYATQESQVTLLFTPSPEDLNGSHSSPNAKYDLRTYAVADICKIRVKADPETLSESILAPMGKVKWESACRETFLAEVEIEVYEHAAWGLVGDRKLVDKRSFKCAGLEFGEDLLTAALEGHK